MNKENTNTEFELPSKLQLACGNVLSSILSRNDFEEIMLNPDGKLYVKFKHGSTEFIDTLDDHRAQIIIRTIASIQAKDIDPQKPIVETQILNLNMRFSGILPPLVSSACFCIRSLNRLQITFDDLIQNGFLTRAQSKTIESLLIAKKNILVCGQTGSGKTTFLNAVLNRLSMLVPSCRIVSIEDTQELNLSSPNYVNLFSTPCVQMSDLVKATMRLSPDRIVIGEVRGDETLDLIDALSTGHSGGIASLHAGSVEQCFERLKLLISKNKSAPKNIENMIALAINAVIIVDKTPNRHIQTIALITGYSNGQFQYQLQGN